jgi:hypothetical protein
VVHDPEFLAKKRELMRRLREEGRLGEAQRFMDAIRRQCATKGLPRAASVRIAWEEMERNFPPLSAEEVAARKEDEGKKPDRTWRPRNWPELPETGKYEDEVNWVYANYSRVIERTKEGGQRIRLSRATSPAPSQGALGLLEWAMDNRTAFYKDVVPKVRRGVDEGEEDKVRKEKRSIGEIRRIIEQMEAVK